MSETGFVIIPWMRKPRGLSTVFQVEAVKLECASRHVATRATLALERTQRKGVPTLEKKCVGARDTCGGFRSLKGFQVEEGGFCSLLLCACPSRWEVDYSSLQARPVAWSVQSYTVVVWVPSEARTSRTWEELR